jgi:Protein of unknown function (DUF2911)
MNRPLITAAALAATLVCLRPGLIDAQGTEQGGFVTRLGTDTLAVERFTRTANRLEGERVLRVPTTALIRYVATLGKDGRVTRFEASRFDGDRLDGPPTWSSTTDFTSKDAVTTFRRGDSTETIRTNTGPGAVPMLTHAYALDEQMVRQARRMKGDTVPMEQIFPGQPGFLPTWVSPIGRDTVAIGSFHGQAAHARVDGDGRLLGYDAQGTVVKVVVTRVPDLDVLAVARQFAARDAAGQAPGPLSPRDTVRARFGGAAFTVDYGRPSKRGRTIFGGLVPYGQVWRTGADAATQFTTTRDLTIGGTDLRTGSYTLWTLPTETGATLIVNAEVGQWGTDYHVKHDVARIPMTVRRLDQPVERFTIDLTSAGGGELRMRWDTTEWVVPVRVK